MSDCYSHYSSINHRLEQTVSCGEVVMTSATSVCFMHSQTLEEDHMWLYTFKFLVGGMARNTFGQRVDELWKARINLSGIQNVANQYYNISDEREKLGMVYGSVSGSGSEIYTQGEYEEVVIGTADILVSAMLEAKTPPEANWYQTIPQNVVGWIWSAASLAGEIVHFIINEKENDFENDSFYRELQVLQASDLGMYWEVKIEVPPACIVRFSVSGDLRSSSGELLAGTPIICQINAPSSLTPSNDNKGVSYYLQPSE